MILVMTCNACPEQYDVYKKGAIVGYMRLRHGQFYTQCTIDDTIVYQGYPQGDGIFEPQEREFYLKKGKRALKKHLKGL